MSTFEEILEKDGKLVYKTKGVSMNPMLYQNRDLVVIEELIQGKTLEQYLNPEMSSEKDRNDAGKNTDGNISLKQPDFEEKKRILLEICDGLSLRQI